MTRLRHPGGLARAALRAPAALYRWRLGWLLGARFLALEHRGRRSGAIHRTVLEVIGRDRERDAWRVVSAWGPRADWYSNVRAHPHVRVTVGRRTFAATARALPPEASEAALREYGRRHRLAASMLRRLFGYASWDDLARALPVVEFTPEAVRGATTAHEDAQRV